MKSHLVWQKGRNLGTTGKINAAVLSPCELYRRAWKSSLVSLVFVDKVKTAATSSEIPLSATDEQPTTILVDAPGSERLLALQLGPFYKQGNALFVVNDYELSTIRPLLKLGVTGFMARDDSVSNFVQIFLATAQGQIGLPPDVANRAVTELVNGDRQNPTLPGHLTRRETEVLHLLADGMSNRDIARTLFLSVRTVEAHLRNLYGKLDVTSRTEAVLWAARHGYASFIYGRGSD